MTSERRLKNLGDENVSDFADRASLAFNRELEAALGSMQWRTNRQAELVQNLKKVGKYGICIDCGEEISSQRLKADENAVRCLKCEEKRESSVFHSGGHRGLKFQS